VFTITGLSEMVNWSTSANWRHGVLRHVDQARAIAILPRLAGDLPVSEDQRVNTHVSGDIGGFVDIHCHLLPGIDDGADSWTQMLAMARIAVSESIQTIIATPHQLGVHRQNHGQLIRQRTQEVQQRLDDENVNLRVYPGADVRIEESMFQGLKSGDVLTLADRG